MYQLLDSEYADLSASSSSNCDERAKSAIRSILDEDFDYDDEESADELERYASEKLARKEVDVLTWWKVNNFLLSTSPVELILIQVN
jgi:hypothetical protein